MDAKTREALEASIQHWRENVAAEKVDNAATNDNTCALCKCFLGSGLSRCVGCPVAKRTGMHVCKNTPYWNAAAALFDWRASPHSVNRKRKFKEAAQAELDFLISLREDKEDAQ